MASVQAHLFAEAGVLEQTAEGVVIHAQSDELDWFARQLAGMPFDFEIRQPPALHAAVGSACGGCCAAASRRLTFSLTPSAWRQAAAAWRQRLQACRARRRSRCPPVVDGYGCDLARRQVVAQGLAIDLRQRHAGERRPLPLGVLGEHHAFGQYSTAAASSPRLLSSTSCLPSPFTSSRKASQCLPGRRRHSGYR
jgi:hypothetical protein